VLNDTVTISDFGSLVLGNIEENPLSSPLRPGAALTHALVQQNGTGSTSTNCNGSNGITSSSAAVVAALQSAGWRKVTRLANLQNAASQFSDEQGVF
jgi:hypothetical protein